MGNYSIKQLESLSGIKAHTIRIWEQRYKLLAPHRTDTNIRFYDDNHLKKILNVSLLNENGLKISKIAQLSEIEINEKVRNFQTTNNSDLEKEAIIKNLMLTVLKLDEEAFEAIISKQITSIGFQNTIETIIYPLLNSIGMLWGINKVNPAQEHFISNLIRQKIISATDKLNIVSNFKYSCVLYLPEKEMHELGLLTANYFLRAANIKTYYLGQNVPNIDLLSIIDQVSPKSIITFITTKTTELKIKRHLNEILDSFPNIEILLSGNIQLLSNISVPNRVTLIKSIPDFLRKI